MKQQWRILLYNPLLPLPSLSLLSLSSPLFSSLVSPAVLTDASFSLVEGVSPQRFICFMN